MARFSSQYLDPKKLISFLSPYSPPVLFPPLFQFAWRHFDSIGHYPDVFVFFLHCTFLSHNSVAQIDIDTVTGHNRFTVFALLALLIQKHPSLRAVFQKWFSSIKASQSSGSLLGSSELEFLIDPKVFLS